MLDLFMVQRGIVQSLRGRHQQPADGSRNKQASQNRLQDSNPRVRRDDTSHDGKDGATNLGDNKDKCERCWVKFWREEP